MPVAKRSPSSATCPTRLASKVQMPARVASSTQGSTPLLRFCRSFSWHELVRDPMFRYSTFPLMTKLYALCPPSGMFFTIVSAAPSTVSPTE